MGNKQKRSEPNNITSANKLEHQTKQNKRSGGLGQTGAYQNDSHRVPAVSDKTFGTTCGYSMVETTIRRSPPSLDAHPRIERNWNIMEDSFGLCEQLDYE